MTPLLSPMDEAFASFDAALRSRTCTPVPGDFKYAPESARYHMQPQPRAMIDFSLPQDDVERAACPLSWSTNHILAFPRGNRVYLKNVYSSIEDVGYTFKPMKKHGILRLLDFASETPNILALGTANGNIELWDIEARKMTQCWTAVGLTRFQWNEGRVLAVGDEKGSIQYYDTRIDDRKEMKMKKGKVTRHEAAITTLSWNRRDPRYLATGDRDGVVYFWDNRQDAPLNIGEMVQRRRKMQHDNPVSVSQSSLGHVQELNIS
jgi:cell division cycle protein 20 (cofactor of APC complex)